MKIINTIDDARKYLKDFQFKRAKEKQDHELMEILLGKDEYDEQFIEIIKSEIKYRKLN